MVIMTEIVMNSIDILSCLHLKKVYQINKRLIAIIW